MFTNAKSQSFKQKQLMFPRVEEAFTSKWPELHNAIKSRGINPDKFYIFFRVFKLEKRTEVWISNKKNGKFQHLKTYVTARSSGILGPKRAERDLQVPEGYYFVDRFNPVSSYYLSLGINYPNTSDKILGKEKPGSDIFIHGSDVTVGCIPLTDDKMKEIYALAVQAKSSGQSNIEVHIFPFELSEPNLTKHKNDLNFPFWLNLKAGFDYFEKNGKLPTIKIDDKGNYSFN